MKGITMNAPMLPDNSYQDAQGTTYLVQANEQPASGNLQITIIFRKVLILYCDAARLNDGRFQFQLPGTALWMQMAFSPIRSKMVPA